MVRRSVVGTVSGDFVRNFLFWQQSGLSGKAPAAYSSIGMRAAKRNHIHMIAYTAELRVVPHATAALGRTGIAGFITFISEEDRMSRTLSSGGRSWGRSAPL